MKYYIGEVHERNGEFEYTAQYLFAIETSPKRYTKKTTMEWRGSDRSNWDKEEEGYWCWETLIYDNGHKEIPKEDFEVLRKYITVL